MTVRILIGAMALIASAAASAQTRPFDRAAWLRDYDRLKIALAQDYANLDWQAERRGLNLASADRMISAMLQKADSDVAATLVFAKLVEAFKDPHLELNAGPPPPAATLVPRSSDTEGPARVAGSCEEAGYANGGSATRLPYARAPGWTEVSPKPFLAGMIGDVGIIRIPGFGEDRYLDACKAVAKKGLGGRDLQLATRAELNRQLAALVATMKARGMRRLAIDLSRNGGGSEWSSDAAALFAAGQLARTEPRRVGPTCDRSVIWKGEKPGCSPYAGEPARETIENEGPPAWAGPLAILADRRTASAAEEFITWLRDNGKAAMGGERTFGAGCGYMDGGNSFAFTAASMHLMIPNCSRFTRDGVNEIEGQAPDLPIDWQTLSPAEVPATLDRLFALAPKPASG